MRKNEPIKHVKTASAKRGRPFAGNAMTPAQRQQASRTKRLSERFESCPARQINILLSPQATQALDMLTSYRDKSQKELIEELLIYTYANYKENM